MTSNSNIDDLDNLVVAQQGSLLASSNTCESVTSARGPAASAVSSSASSTSKTQSIQNTDDKKKSSKAEDDDSSSRISDLTKELNQMSLPERERALYDLHGISGTLQEGDTKQVQEWLQQLDELVQDQAKEHPGLAEALRINPQFIQQERMKFLRADEYDPVKAALRMGHYFDMKMEYFCGDGQYDCLARDLTIFDLSEEDLEYWKTGFYQVCREKDSAGRIVTILFLQVAYHFQIPVDSMVRAYFVMNTILTQNVEVQRSGYVGIAYAVGLGEDSMKFIGSDVCSNSIIKAPRWCPLRGVAKHFCYDHESLHPMFGKYAKPMATFNAARFRSHFGTNAEVLYNLATFGISTSTFPISNAGVVQTDFHLGMIQFLLSQQKQRDDNENLQLGADQKIDKQVNGGEVDAFHGPGSAANPIHSTLAMTGENEVIYVLNPMDVILGRGAHNKSNPGNIRLKMLLEEYYAEYNFASNRAQKTAIVNAIMGHMNEVGSRFVYEIEGGKEIYVDVLGDSSEYPLVGDDTSFRQWMQAPPEKVRDKISHDFRNMRRTENTNKKKSRDHYQSKERVKRIMDSNTGTKPAAIQQPYMIGSSSIFPQSVSQSLLQTSGDGSVLDPGEMDIIIGHHKKKANLGNLLLKQLVEEHYDEYEAANQETGSAANAKKNIVVQSVLSRMEEAGTRFLVCDSEGICHNAPPGKIHDKVTQDFRNLRWSKKKKTQQRHTLL